MNEEEAIFFAGWEGVLEIFIVTPIVYGLVVLFVRLSGKRTTSQMNNFDWIVTIAMGSTVASGIVINTVEVAEAAAAIFSLLALQWVATKLAHRFTKVDEVLKAKPRILIDRGVVDEAAMKRERITKDELTSALRRQGVSRLADIHWLILENTGEFSLLTKEQARRGVDSFVVDRKEIGPKGEVPLG